MTTIADAFNYITGLLTAAHAARDTATAELNGIVTKHNSSKKLAFLHVITARQAYDAVCTHRDSLQEAVSSSHAELMRQKQDMQDIVDSCNEWLAEDGDESRVSDVRTAVESLEQRRHEAVNENNALPQDHEELGEQYEELEGVNDDLK